MKYIHYTVWLLSNGFSKKKFLKVKANELMDRISVTIKIVFAAIFSCSSYKCRKLEIKIKFVSVPLRENNT